MFIKVLSTFLVIQFFSFALWMGTQAMAHKPAVKPAPNEVAAQHAASTIEHKKFDQIRFSAKGESDSYNQINADRKSEVLKVLQHLPASHTRTLKNIILDYSPKAHRGLGGRNTIIMRAVDMDPNEFASVLIHEIGHSADLGHLDGKATHKVSEFMDGSQPIYENDLSLEFYRISWINEKNRKKTASNMDFVSGYAMSDPFEDFAESYVFYILHNREFKSLTATNDALAKKYNFIKNEVFNGKEFNTGEQLSENLWRRPWDITVLSYEMENFINS